MALLNSFPGCCHPRCPWRAPDWRWKLAAHPSDTIAAFGCADDAWLQLAVAVRQGRDSQFSEDSASRAKSISEACRLRPELSEWDRVIIAARLLTGESPSQLAGQVGIPQDTLEAYAALFFDVRDKLQHPSWIVHRVIGRPTYLPRRPIPHLQMLTRLYAYFGGPHVLDAVLGTYRDTILPHATIADEALHTVPDAELARDVRRAVNRRKLPPEECVKLVANVDLSSMKTGSARRGARKSTVEADGKTHSEWMQSDETGSAANIHRSGTGHPQPKEAGPAKPVTIGGKG